MSGHDFDPQYYHLDWDVDHTNDRNIASLAAERFQAAGGAIAEPSFSITRIVMALAEEVAGQADTLPVGGQPPYRVSRYPMFKQGQWDCPPPGGEVAG